MSLNEVERNAHLVTIVSGMKEDILARLKPGVTGEGPVVVNARSLSNTSMHAVAAVELRQNGTGIRFVAKCDLPAYQGPQRLETEESLLRGVGSEIWATNARARCPQVLAFFPEHKLLLLEMVEGKSLKELLFGVGLGHSNIENLLALSGEWLGRFHSLTQREQANPFVWLQNAFAETKVQDAFRLSGVPELYAPLERLLQQFAGEYPDFCRPLCQLHVEFTPLHVLVKGGTIYVFDLGASRVGFGYEDAAMFTTFLDAVMPWRAVTSSFRMSLAKQKSAFLDSYFAHWGQDFDLTDQIVMRFASLHAMAHHESCWERVPPTWARALNARFGRQWLRRRFAAMARKELDHLQQVASVPPVWHLDVPGSPTPYTETIASDSQELK